MDLQYTAEYIEFQEEVRAFLAANWTSNPSASKEERQAQVKAFHKAAIDAGYLFRNIPKKYGGSEQPADVLKAQIIRDEFRNARAPQAAGGNGVGLLVPTLLEAGEEWQKEMFVPKTLTGEYMWAQGYSEPGSGSDLASLRTKGELIGDEWVINGQKVWTSQAQQCQYMFILVRTEPNASKHAGISYLLLDLRQPGVDIRPLKQITGQSEFNEIFFENVKTPANWIVGKRGEGWTVSRTTLKHERTFISGAERYEVEFSKVVQLARSAVINGKPAIENERIRERLSEIEGYVLSHKYSSYRQLSTSANGKDPGNVVMMNKIIGTSIGVMIAKLAQDLMADDGLKMPVLADRNLGGGAGRAQRPGNEKWVGHYLGSLGMCIAGGTSNIQRNVIAERGLGLPRDPLLSGK